MRDADGARDRTQGKRLQAIAFKYLFRRRKNGRFEIALMIRRRA